MKGFEMDQKLFLCQLVVVCLRIVPVDPFSVPIATLQSYALSDSPLFIFDV